jgi:sugar phosphate isomerase/epimerase
MNKRLEIGVIVGLEDDMVIKLNKVKQLGLTTCQIALSPENLDNKKRDSILKAVELTGVRVTTLFFLCYGYIWDLIDGPDASGFIPVDTRKERFRLARVASDFAESVKINSLTTHLGFIPENPKDTVYKTLIPELKEFAVYCKSKNQVLCFETGQETPVTLHRTILDVGTDNLGVNFDTANLMLYGKANPVDALDILGKFVKGVHCKDGDYPTDPNKLGAEYPLGDGKVNFPVFIPKLVKMGYAGALTIEREITGDQQTKDILMAKSMLEKIMDNIKN